MKEQQPEKIGKYDVVDVLGKGSMGVVYKGHDAYVDRPVAIKVATNAEAGFIFLNNIAFMLLIFNDKLY